MTEATTSSFPFPSADGRDVLSEILREGAQRMLSHAIEGEVAEWIDARSDLVNERGHRQVVRNGRLPHRTIMTGVGHVEIKQPRVRDRRSPDQAEKFTSNILPRYLRKSGSIEKLIPWLYLKGISTGDFNEALQALVGVPGTPELPRGFRPAPSPA